MMNSYEKREKVYEGKRRNEEYEDPLAHNPFENGIGGDSQMYDDRESDNPNFEMRL